MIFFRDRLFNIIALIALALSVTSVAAACAEGPAGTPYTARQIADVMIASQDETAVLHPLSAGDDYFSEYLSDIYRAGGIRVADGVIFYTAGMLADEIAVFVLEDESDARIMQDALEEYIKGRVSAFTGYAPAQAAVLKGGKVAVQGRHVALIICQDVKQAQSAFMACFSDPPPALPALPAASGRDTLAQPTDAGEEPVPASEQASSPAPEETAAPEKPPETSPPDFAEDIYDPQSIIDAYRTGDESGLTPKNKAILDACYDVIYALISDDMSDYDKELAIHDWIIDNAGYDEQSLSNAPDASPDPDNDNPYGLLMNGKAICRGYTFTFQLFMDLLGIECITVHGSRSDGLEHAWNMVRIDGEWYCVDVTWNDPAGSGEANISERHRFFNVSSRFMRETGHVWDESAVPEATAGKLYY